MYHLFEYFDLFGLNVQLRIANKPSFHSHVSLLLSVVFIISFSYIHIFLELNYSSERIPKPFNQLLLQNIMILLTTLKKVTLLLGDWKIIWETRCTQKE